MTDVAREAAQGEEGRRASVQLSSALISTESPAAGKSSAAGQARDAVEILLDYAKHDGADKSQGEVRGNNAQSSDERHGMLPLFARALRAAGWLTESLFPKKSALLSLIGPCVACAGTGMVKEP
jgi:hypothetical protein